MFYIEHESGQLASKGATGQHNATLVNSVHDAEAYSTRAEAYEASQNYGPEWNVYSPED